MSALKIAVLASGRGSNLQSMIDAIAEKEIDAQIVMVLSDKKDAYALQRAKNNAIPCDYLQPSGYANREAYDLALAAKIKESGAELVVLAGFMRILSPSFLNCFPNRVINIHPALLPAFPGLHAQKQAFDYGVKISGCTVHFVDAGMDTGKIIAQKAVPVLDTDTADRLADRILVAEHALYPEVIGLFAQQKIKIINDQVKIEY